MFSKLATAILVTIVVLSGLHVDAAPRRLGTRADTDGEPSTTETVCFICLDPGSYNTLLLEDRLTNAY